MNIKSEILEIISKNPAGVKLKELYVTLPQRKRDTIRGLVYLLLKENQIIKQERGSFKPKTNETQKSN
jgi:hypothetical protein